MKTKIKQVLRKAVALCLVGVVSSAGTFFMLSSGIGRVDTSYVSNSKAYGTGSGTEQQIISALNENEVAYSKLKNDYNENKLELSNKLNSINGLIVKLEEKDSLTTEEQTQVKDELTKQINEYNSFVTKYDAIMSSNISSIENLDVIQQQFGNDVSVLQGNASELQNNIISMRGDIDTMQTDISVLQASTSIASIGNLMYPVGSVYISASDIDPATIFGGTWRKIEDKFLLSSGSTYAAGTTGGAATHSLTTSELPAHNHIIPPLTGSTSIGGGHTHSLTNDNIDFTVGYAGGSGRSGIPGDVSGWGSYGSADWFIINCYAKYNGEHSHSLSTNQSTSGSTGGNAAFSIMPPYMTVNMWERVTLA